MSMQENIRTLLQSLHLQGKKRIVLLIQLEDGLRITINGGIIRYLP